MKQKRKQAPMNTRRYWITFSLLAIVLLIPFRIINHPNLTKVVYFAIMVMTGMRIRQIIKQITWARPLTVLMLICLIVPIFQIRMTTQKMHGWCTPPPSSEETTYWIIFESRWCSGTGFTESNCLIEQVAIKNTPILIHSLALPFDHDVFCN